MVSNKPRLGMGQVYREASAEAKRRGDRRVSTEHIALAMLVDPTRRPLERSVSAWRQRGPRWKPWTARRSHLWGSTLVPTLPLSLVAWGAASVDTSRQGRLHRAPAGGGRRTTRRQAGPVRPAGA